MKRLIITGALIAGLTLGGWALWQRGNAANARADQAEQQRDTAQQENQRRQVVIDALWENAQRLESQRRALAEQQTELARTASDRLEQIQELQRDNDEIREWAGTRLPADVIRLRQRSAVTGAAAYRQSVRDPDALHATGESSDQ
ncbi:hypothetical protein GCM10010082_06090 [Kushneria pakistanensis]|uniref:LysB family phage lysis regulatory protein n=1 Tax=Kushneria pakistanensis TaxID=1508770 RepID=A0ABQ3FC50_9GAMM|nr:Rz-like lysis system protein LysB [Kushneria pakistanensis]GHC17624.1 hypothetical protein GCM10010082_06090 [Kushneria pakistanensis]